MRTPGRWLVTLTLSGALTLSTMLAGRVVTAAEEPDPCPGDSVRGTVVAVFEASGTVVIETADGRLCTVMIRSGSEFDHPIVALLGSYFGQVSTEDLAGALESTEVWVVCAGARVCVLAHEGDAGAVAATVVAVTDNGDGSSTIVLELSAGAGAVSVTTDDADLIEDLSEALEALSVEWALQEGEDGTVVLDAGDQIEALHEDGMGFGVIVKLFTIAAEAQEACPEGSSCVTAAQLVELFESGMGMGQIFEEYGKPTTLGVGHVRKTVSPTPTPVPSGR